jgi:hypothetical protein
MFSGPVYPRAFDRHKPEYIDEMLDRVIEQENEPVKKNCFMKTKNQSIRGHLWGRQSPLMMGCLHIYLYKSIGSSFFTIIQIVSLVYIQNKYFQKVCSFDLLIPKFPFR